MNEWNCGWYFFWKRESKITGAGGGTAGWKGKIPFPSFATDCAPAGRRRGRTTPLGALGSDGMGKTGGVLPVGNQVFLLSPSLVSFLGLSVTRDGLTFGMISMVTHFYQEEGHLQDKQETKARSCLPPPLSRFFFHFKLLTYSLKDILETWWGCGSGGRTRTVFCWDRQHCGILQWSFQAFIGTRLTDFGEG